jgi:hypothetical protein
MPPLPDAEPVPGRASAGPEGGAIVVGIPAVPGGGAPIAEQVTADLRRLYPSREATVVLLDGRREASAGPAAAAGEGPPPSALTAGGLAGPESRLPDLLRAAQRVGASLCALVTAERHDEGADWVRLLVSPVLDEGFDYVCPSYLRAKYDGAINNGIVYPLTRALFGKRLRQPLGAELAVSRKLAEVLLRDEEWKTDPVHAGADIWLVTKVLSREFRICQSFLGRFPGPAADRPADLSEVLSRIAGLLFREMERHAPLWQRISGSEPVPTFGEVRVLEDEGQRIDVSRMVGAFELGHQDLRDLWSEVLPPATLLALKHASQQAAAAFRLDDALWARIVFDFAVGYHGRVMDRAQLLKSMTPLYLGWVAGFVNEVRSLDGTGAEARLERLCTAFERQKPYLISRWRWPDRFSP